MQMNIGFKQQNQFLENIKESMVQNQGEMMLNMREIDDDNKVMKDEQKSIKESVENVEKEVKGNGITLISTWKETNNIINKFYGMEKFLNELTLKQNGSNRCRQ
jgi:hypothetical protein